MQCSLLWYSSLLTSYLTISHLIRPLVSLWVLSQLLLAFIFLIRRKVQAYKLLVMAVKLNTLVRALWSLVELLLLANQVWDSFNTIYLFFTHVLLAIQLAKLSGFSTIITTCSPHNADLVKSLGATHVIDRKADVVAEARKVLSEPPKVIYDAVGIETTQTQAIEILAPNGTLLLVLPPIEAVQSAPGNKKAYMVFGSAQLHRELCVKLFANLKEYIEAGKIKVWVVFTEDVSRSADGDLL